jgi:hypothetical protein
VFLNKTNRINSRNSENSSWLRSLVVFNEN